MQAALSCSRCDKRLSRKTARMIDGKLLCSTCMFAPNWPKELRSIEELPWPVRFVSRRELERNYPSDSGRLPEGENAEGG